MPEPPLLTDPQDRDRLERFLARTWAIAAEAGHPLGRLQGLALDACRLLALLGPKNNVGSRYFQLFLVDRAGRLSDEPVAFGLHNTGPYPGYNWLEVVRYQPSPPIAGRSVELRRDGREEALFRALSALVPPGGHLMVEYDSPAQRESERVLTLDYPPITSPLGYLLFRAGCLSFRDWYISEGGREGPRKLQGYKPLDEELAAERAAALRRQLEELLASPERREHGEHGRTARRLAAAVLAELGGAAPASP